MSADSLCVSLTVLSIQVPDFSEDQNPTPNPDVTWDSVLATKSVKSRWLDQEIKRMQAGVAPWVMVYALNAYSHLLHIYLRLGLGQYGVSLLTPHLCHLYCGLLCP